MMGPTSSKHIMTIDFIEVEVGRIQPSSNSIGNGYMHIPTCSVDIYPWDPLKKDQNTDGDFLAVIQLFNKFHPNSTWMGETNLFYLN